MNRRVFFLSADQPRRYRDYRELLQKEKPDIAIVATPDHWHALPTIDAVKAGAHVYVEKPICHTIDEGRAMVKAAREADRLVQVGPHRRVSPHPITGMQFLKSGKVGKIGMVRVFAVAFASSSISPPARWGIGACTGSIRSFGGRTKRTPSRSIRRRAGWFAKTRPTHPIPRS